jgi:dihydrofolate reductase
VGKLIVTEFVTLDGVAQAPGGPDEDRDGGFVHGGWQAPFDDPGAGPVVYDEAKSMDVLLLGRKTYEIFADYWPKASDDIPFTGLLNDVPKHVASRTLTAPLAWQGSTLVTGDLAAGIEALKDQHDEVHVIGAASTWCSHSCAPAWSAGSTCGCTHCCWAAASSCSGAAPSPRRCA